MFYGRNIYCFRCSEKEVLNTLSDFAIKRLSIYSLTKSVFSIVKVLFKSIERLCRSGKC